MPKPPDVSVFTIRTGVLLDADRAVLLAGHRELEGSDVPHTFLFVWKRNGEWAGRRIAWSSGSVTAIGEPPETVLVGEGGEFAILSDAGLEEGVVGERRVLRGVHRVGETAYAVGLRGAFYERPVGGRWRFHQPDLGQDAGIEAVAGSADDELMCVGWQGQIWHVTPGSAERLDAGTNVILTAVCRDDQGVYYACGQRGTIVRGGGATWDLIEHDSTSEDLWDVHWFQGRLYVASLRFLYRLEDGRLVRVDFDGARVLSCYHLMSFEDRLLWSVGGDDVMEYDGTRWQRILGEDAAPPDPAP